MKRGTLETLRSSAHERPNVGRTLGFKAISSLYSDAYLLSPKMTPITSDVEPFKHTHTRKGALGLQ